MNQAWLLVAVAGLIAANGVFVAAEFALVSVRRPAVEEAIARGSRRAIMAKREYEQLSFALSAAQFGITATSLLVGYLADRAVGQLLVAPVLEALGLPTALRLPIALIAALMLSTGLQLVLGELVPKQLALARPLGTVLVLSPLTRAFGRTFRPLIAVFDRSAARLARRLFSIDESPDLEAGHDLDDLADIIHESAEHGTLSTSQTALLQRGVALADTSVQQLMVPRPDVVWVTSTANLDELRQLARQTGHSRFPVRDEHGELVGSVHVKDVLNVAFDRHATTPVIALMSSVLLVPESAPAHGLIQAFRRHGRTFAVAIDEHGAVAGIATVEDVVEALVGDIVDEYDRDVVEIRQTGPRRFVVAGGAAVGQINDRCGVPIPDGPYATIAGFLLEQLGRIPAVGDSLELDGWLLIVTGVDALRVTEVTIRRQVVG